MSRKPIFVNEKIETNSVKFTKFCHLLITTQSFDKCTRSSVARCTKRNGLANVKLLIKSSLFILHTSIVVIVSFFLTRYDINSLYYNDNYLQLYDNLLLFYGIYFFFYQRYNYTAHDTIMLL